MLLKCPRFVGGMVGLGLKVSKRQQREGVRRTRQVVGGGSCVGNGGAAAELSQGFAYALTRGCEP